MDPISQLFYTVRPLLGWWGYSSSIKSQLADAYQQKIPSLTRAEAEALVDVDIRNNRVPALDPLGGAFKAAKKARAKVDRARANPEQTKAKASAGWLAIKIFVGIWLFSKIVDMFYGY